MLPGYIGACNIKMNDLGLALQGQLKSSKGSSFNPIIGTQNGSSRNETSTRYMDGTKENDPFSW